MKKFVFELKNIFLIIIGVKHYQLFNKTKSEIFSFDPVKFKFRHVT